ncbi:hypothetical protein B0H17DRAFT_923215, partial [Mycena rosella]
SPQTCGDPSDAVPFYLVALPGQAFYYTALASDVNSLINPPFSYSFIGTAARVFTTQELSTVPFFHVRSGSVLGPLHSDNLYTTSTTERDSALVSGYVDTGIAGYIYPSQICGSVPFYRLFTTTATVTEHFYTINATYRATLVASGAWTDEGIAGYVLDFNVCA